MEKREADRLQKEKEREAERALKEQEQKEEMERLRKEREARVQKELEEMEKRKAEAEKAREQREAEEKIEREDRERKYQEQMAKRAEEEKARQIENSMLLRYLKAVTFNERTLDAHREVLASHRGFDLRTIFEHLDSDNDGKLTAEEISEAFEKANCPVGLEAAKRIIVAVDDDNDGTVDMREFENACAPRCAAYKVNHSCSYNSFESEYLSSQAIMSALGDLLLTFESSQRELEALRNELKLDAERLFEDMDEFRVGHVSANQLGRWVRNNCFFELHENDLARVQSVLAPGSDYRISKAAFVQAVSAESEEEKKEETKK